CRRRGQRIAALDAEHAIFGNRTVAIVLRGDKEKAATDDHETNDQQGQQGVQNIYQAVGGAAAAFAAVIHCGSSPSLSISVEYGPCCGSGAKLWQSACIFCNGWPQRQGAHRASARCAPLERWKSQATLRMTSVALVPPKPKLLERATLISFLSATLGTRLMAVSTEGLSRLSVGGAILSRMASMQKIASTEPAAPRRCPMADLVELITARSAASPRTRVTAP